MEWRHLRHHVISRRQTTKQWLIDAFRSALNLGQDSPRRGPSIRLNHGSAAEQVLASELQGRDDASDALSMMVSSMVHMVQAGKTRSNGSRWSA